MKPTRRQSVSLVTETGMFLLMTTPLISGGPLLRLRCSARVCHCLRLLVGVVDWCAKSVCKTDLLLIQTASSPESLLICRSLNCHPYPSIITFVFRSSEVKHLLLDLDSYGVTHPLGMFPLVLRRTTDVMETSPITLLAGYQPISSQFSERSTVLLCCNHRPISITSVLPIVCLGVWCRFVLDDLWNAVVSFFPPGLLIGKVFVSVKRFCACPMHCKVH